jgi:pre-mRNA-splicing factor 38B
MVVISTTAVDLFRLVPSYFIRATGFMYLRYICNPKQLWDWLAPFLYDEEEIWLRGKGKGKATTIGLFVRDLLKEQRYFELLLPRIPVPVQRDLNQRLQEYEDENPQEEPAKPARAAERDRGTVGRSNDRDRDGRDRGYDRDRDNRERDRDRDRGYDRDRGRGRDTRDRERERDRERDRDRDGERGRGRSKSRSRSRDRHRRGSKDRSRDRKKRSYSSRSRSRSTSRSPKEKKRDKSPSKPNNQILEQLKSIYGDSSASKEEPSYKGMGKYNSLQEEVILLGAKKRS